eukprot:UN04422
MSVTTQELRGMVRKTPEILLKESSEKDKHSAIYNALEKCTRQTLMSSKPHTRRETSYMIAAQIISFTIPYITRLN